MAKGPLYSIIPNDWQSLEDVINELGSRLYNYDQSLSSLLAGSLADAKSYTDSQIGDLDFSEPIFVGSYAHSITGVDDTTIENTAGVLNVKAGVFQAAGSYLTSISGEDHSSLSNLDYASSGHTGFQPAGSYLTDLSSLPYGTANQIPFMNGTTAFQYSANLIFDGTNLTCLGSLGAGTAALVANGITLTHTTSLTSQKGISLVATNTRGSGVPTSLLIAIDFIAKFQPTSPSAARTLTTLYGGNAQLSVVSSTTAAFNATATTVRGFYSTISASDGGGGGTGNIGTATLFYANSVTKGSGSITTAYAFYDAGQSAATTNWGLAINTANSYINGSLRIGSAVAPTVALDVTGAILGSTTIEATTGFKCGGTAAVADGTYPIYNDGTTSGQVTSITTKGGLITGIAVIP